MNALDTSGMRYSKRTFPAYRFIPGSTPHPTRDVGGHSYGQQAIEPITFEPEQWFASEQYLFGVDLFNHRYWWEAHEAFEPLWVSVGRTTPAGYFIQGLIQIAAGMLKSELGQIDAAVRLCEEGVEKLVLKSGHFLGIDVHRFVRDVRRALAGSGGPPPMMRLLSHDELR